MKGIYNLLYSWWLSNTAKERINMQEFKCEDLSLNGGHGIKGMKVGQQEGRKERRKKKERNIV